MVIAILTILGLAWGSFVNALVFRLYMQSKHSRQSPVASRQSSGRVSKAVASDKRQATSDYSILKGRSMCPSCRHTLAASDLIPLVSWLALRGKCRYCHKPIPDSPLVEAATALVFVLSYLLWPLALAGAASLAVFGLWLAMVVILMALAVYDFRWQLLPDKLVVALAVVAVAQAVVAITSASDPMKSLAWHVIASAIGGGLFLIIILVNDKWIGGGDVKLGFVIGLIAATPAKSVLMIFLAALIGTIASLPLLVNKKLGVKSTIPFGPFLIVATGLVVIFGQDIVNWYFNLINVA